LTLKENKNHYNIKFLKGYGYSISVKNSKIILKDNHDPFSEPQKEEWFVKNMPYEKILLSGKGDTLEVDKDLLKLHKESVKEGVENWERTIKLIIDVADTILNLTGIEKTNKIGSKPK